MECKIKRTRMSDGSMAYDVVLIVGDIGISFDVVDEGHADRLATALADVVDVDTWVEG